MLKIDLKQYLSVFVFVLLLTFNCEKKSVEQIVPLLPLFVKKKKKKCNSVCFLHESNLVFTLRHLPVIRGAKLLSFTVEQCWIE